MLIVASLRVLYFLVENTIADAQRTQQDVIARHAITSLDDVRWEALLAALPASVTLGHLSDSLECRQLVNDYLGDPYVVSAAEQYHTISNSEELGDEQRSNLMCFYKSILNEANEKVALKMQLVNTNV